MFIEVIPWLVGYADHGKIRIVGKGQVPVSFTSIADTAGTLLILTSCPALMFKIAGFVAYVLTTLPPSELENRIFRLEGERGSMNGLAAQFKTSVEQVDKITGDAGEMKTGLLALVDSGACSTGWDEANKRDGSGSKAAGSANALWPGHQWKSVKEVHNL
jgi:hypothetical protein